MDSRILVIADDFTGATDIGTAFVESGRTVRVHITEPDAFGDLPAGLEHDGAEVEIFALKIRSAPVSKAIEAVRQALDCARYNPESDRLYFKYCSTFDSTPEGNIGPVLDALRAASGATHSVVVPAYPDNGRTQYQGYLFVGDRLLSESHMKDHPVTPMTDSSVVRLLQAQTPTACDLVDLQTVRSEQLVGALADSPVRPRYSVVDAIDTGDLTRIATVVQDQKLVSGGSGLAKQYPQTGRSARVSPKRVASTARVIIAGSQSAATRNQLAFLQKNTTTPTFEVDVDSSFESQVDALSEWFDETLEQGSTVLVRRPDLQPGQAPDPAAGQLLEDVFAASASAAYEKGVRQFLVAGGESAGAVVAALEGVTLAIGPDIDEGVPWCLVQTRKNDEVAIALKSGNFGEEDFFVRAWEVLDS